VYTYRHYDPSAWPGAYDDAYRASFLKERFCFLVIAQGQLRLGEAQPRASEAHGPGEPPIVAHSLSRSSAGQPRTGTRTRNR